MSTIKYEVTLEANDDEELTIMKEVFLDILDENCESIDFYGAIQVQEKG